MTGSGDARPRTTPEVRGTAVLGGSFNPPHRTHVRLARDALAALPVHRLLVIPSGDHPHKRGAGMAPAAHRLAMCRLAFDGVPGVVVDDREIRRTGPSFTVLTIHELRAERPDEPVFFLIGSDNLPLLPTWRAPERILALCSVATWPRRGYPVDAAALRGLDLTDAERRSLLAHVLERPADDVNASELRARWRAGETDLDELDPRVRRYLAEHGLYR
jgi:nicotinate-nucleotide adenylyltransferase